MIETNGRQNNKFRPPNDLSPELLADWLSWAGARLLALPPESIFPRVPHACWPDYEIEQFQLLVFRKLPKLRVPAPSKDEIPIMEEILLFPNYCEFILRRRVLHLRLLTNPKNCFPIYSWPKIADKINTSVDRSKNLYHLGLLESSRKIPETSVRFVSDYFSAVPILEL